MPAPETEPHPGPARGPLIEIRKSWLELGITLVLLILGASYISQALSLPPSLNAGDVGPGSFPLILGGATMFALVLLLIATLRRMVAGGEAERVAFARIRAVLAGAVTLILAVVLFERLGTAATLYPGCLLLMLAAGERRALPLILIPAGILAAIYLLFVLILRINLP